MKTIKRSKAKTNAKSQKPKAKPPGQKNNIYRKKRIPKLNCPPSGVMCLGFPGWASEPAHGGEGTKSNPLQNYKACETSKSQAQSTCAMHPVSWPHGPHTHGGHANKRLLILHNPPFNEAFRNTTTRRQTCRDARHA